MNYFRILFIVIMTVAISGCLAAKQPEQSAWGGSEEWRLKSLEENFLNFKEGMREQKDLIDKNHAEVSSKIENLQDKVNELDKTVANLKELQQILAMKAKEEISDVAVISEPDRGVNVESGEAVEVENEEVVMGGTASNEEKPWMNVPGEVIGSLDTPVFSEQAKPAPVVAAKPAPVQPADPVSSLRGDALYKEGVRLVLDDKPVESRNILTQYVNENPSAKLTPNALYWIGETYYSEKNFAQSILKFKEVSRRFPKASKVPDSMLKIGLAYNKLGDRDNSIFYLRTLIEDYPKSDPAKIGKARLREIEG